MSERRSAAGFTGLHMLLTMLVFFGIVIAVNLTMAVFASTSWTGFVVANSYVASQEFNEKMALTRAQAALHWQSRFRVEHNVLRYGIWNAEDASVPLKAVKATFRRPVDDREDHVVTLLRDEDGGFSLGHELADGLWLVEVEAEAEAGLNSPYRETLRVQLIGGTAR